MNPVYINAGGIVTGKGVGLESHKALWAGEAQSSAGALEMTNFKPAPWLSDKRQLKAVSDADAIGLVAIEDLNKSFAPMMQKDPSKNGLYVGSPPASAFDNKFYFDAMLAAGPTGAVNVTDFGATCMQSKPTTLLIGLPNNVLCYGSIILGVKGPNSNYTATFLSGHMALINAARRIQRGQIGSAVAGGFAMHSEAVNSSMFEQLGVGSPDGGTASVQKIVPIADGSVFLGLSGSRGSNDLELEYIDGALASDGAGPRKFDSFGHAYEKMILDLLGRNSVSKESVGLILANSSGLGQLDACENTVLSRVYANERVLPALGCSRKIFGNLMEAGGLVEMCFIRDLYEAGRVPEQMRLPEYNSGTVSFTDKIDSNRPYALVLRASPWGEYSAVLVKYDRGENER